MDTAVLRHHFAPRRELGRTDFRATILGIGDLADRSVPLQDCVATVRRAMNYGLNVIDTAPGYENGYSEEIVGAALNGRQDRMFVIDKIDHFDQPIEPQVDESLRRLQLDHVDLIVFHGLSSRDAWTWATSPGGGFEQLDRCVRAGKVRFRGTSSHDPDTLRVSLEAGLCDVVMFPVGPFVDPRYIGEILPLARHHHVGTVCFKTFGAGKLLGDTRGYGRPLRERPRGKLGSGGVATATPVLPHLSVRECVHYTLTCDPDVALLGMSFPNELDAAAEAAASFQPLHAHEMADIRCRAAAAVEGKGACGWNPTLPA